MDEEYVNSCYLCEKDITTEGFIVYCDECRKCRKCQKEMTDSYYSTEEDRICDNCVTIVSVAVEIIIHQFL